MEKIGKINIDLNKLKDGEIIYYIESGWRPGGFKQIRYNKKRRELRYEGHDGTGNSFFFSRFNCRINLDEAVALMSFDEFKELCELCDVEADDDTLADAYNDAQDYTDLAEDLILSRD